MNPKIEEILQAIKAGEPQWGWFDIDGVIADTSLDGDYTSSIPDEAMIATINEMHSLGHVIVIFTSRGTKRAVEMREAITLQLKEWDVHYERLLIMRRDFTVDDSTLRPDEFLDLLELPNGETKTEAEDMGDIQKDPTLVMETKEIGGHIVDFTIHTEEITRTITASDSVKRDCPTSPDGIHAIFSPENMTGNCIYCGKTIA